MSSRDTIPLFTRALIAISMAADHPSLLMRAMQIENAISPHEADDPDLEKRLPAKRAPFASRIGSGNSPTGKFPGNCNIFPVPFLELF